MVARFSKRNKRIIEEQSESKRGREIILEICLNYSLQHILRKKNRGVTCLIGRECRVKI